MTTGKTKHAKKEENGKEHLVEKHHSVRDLLSNPLQLVFFVFAGFTVIMLVPFTLAGYRFSELNRANKPEGYEWPEASDLYITMIASVGFAIVEIVVRKIAYHFFIPFCKEQENLKLREVKSQKAAFKIY